MATLTCHTEDWINPATGEVGPCPSMDKPVDLPITYPDPDTGETVTVDAVVCGACGQQITDITP